MFDCFDEVPTFRRGPNLLGSFSELLKCILVFTDAFVGVVIIAYCVTCFRRNGRLCAVLAHSFTQRN